MNARQRRFVDEYLVDLNATQAALRAGYSKRSAYSIGQENLKKPEVLAAIEKAQAELAQRTQVTADYVVANLKEVVERCMQRAPVMVRSGREMVQLQDEEGRDVWQFDARGANGALNLLGKRLGLFTVKHELTGKDGAPIEVNQVVTDDLRRKVESRIAGIASRIGADGVPSQSNGNGTHHPRP